MRTGVRRFRAGERRVSPSRTAELTQEQETIDQCDRGLGFDSLLVRCAVDELGAPFDPESRRASGRACSTARDRSQPGRSPRRRVRRPDRLRSLRRSATPPMINSRWSAAGSENATASVCWSSSSHGEDHLADQIVLRREVVDDDAIADSETLGHAPEGELAQAIVECGGQRPVEDLGLGVFVPHELDCSGHCD